MDAPRKLLSNRKTTVFYTSLVLKGAFVWDQSGMWIIRIMRVSVCLGATHIPEYLEFHSGYSAPRSRITGIYSYSRISHTNASLSPFQTANFTYAESNANEKNLLFSLICIRFGTCKVRRLKRALVTSYYETIVNFINGSTPFAAVVQCTKKLWQLLVHLV